MMVVDTGAGLVSEAETAYSRVTTHPVRYIDFASEVAERARESGDQEALVVATRALAWARHAVLDNAGAKTLLDDAVRRAERHDLPHRLGEVLVTRAVALHELGRQNAAMRDLQRAEPLVTAPQRADLIMQQALLHHSAGRLGTAVTLYRRALDDPACPTIIWVKAANNISNALTQLGKPRAALEYLDRAVALAADLGPLLLGVLTNSLAWSSFYAGLVAASVRRFEEAGPLYAAAGIPLGEHYMDYSDALVDLRLIGEAAVVARSAAVEFDRHGARLMAAEARLRCARLALALGDTDLARADAEAAVADLRRQRRSAWVARAEVVAAQTDRSATAPRRVRVAAVTLARHGLRADAVEAHLLAGRMALAAGRRVPARRHLAAATALAQRQSLVVRLRGRVAAALRAEVGGSPARALRECRAGLADLARHRAALPSVELRVLAAGHGAELGELGLRSLLRRALQQRGAGGANAVLRWLEQTRAASLLTVQPPVPGVEEDVTALRGLDREIKAARRERGEVPRDLLARQSALEARIRKLSWVRESASGGVPDGAPHRIVSIGELRSALDGQWLVELAPVDGRVLAVVVEPHRTRLVDTAALDEVVREVDAVLFALRRLLRGGRHVAQARTAAAEALGALRALVIGPLGVPADVPLVVVPSGPLLRVPWSPLVDGPVSVAPSATFWALSRRAGDESSSRVALVAGPGLPGAAREIDALRAVHPDAAALLPPHSTAAATLELLARTDLAHLACHGRLRSDSPLFSALELSDGPLTLHELFERGVAPRRVVLAACESGVERSYAGGEVLGFVSALMARGTAGVVAAGLPIPDGASVAAMTALHDGLRRGEPLSRALFSARTRIEPESADAYVAWCTLTAYGAA